jgi:hypothetical protein
MQRQTSEAGSPLSIHPSKIEVLGGHAPDRRSVTGMKADDSAPDVSRRSTIIHKEGVCPAATSEKIRAGPAI